MEAIYARGGRIENATLYAAPVRRQRSRWEQDNEAPVNVAAFVTLGLLGLAFAGLIVLLALT
jgi:hypothetical protein